MVNERQRLRMMETANQQSTRKTLHFGRWTVHWQWSHVREPDPSQEIDAPVSRTTPTKHRFCYDKVRKRQEKRADDDRQHRQTTVSNQQSTKRHVYLRLLATRICKWYCRICSTRGAIDTQSFAYQRYTANQTDGTTLTATSRIERQNELVDKEWFQMVDSHPHIHTFQLDKLMPIHPHGTWAVVLFLFLFQSCSIL